VADRSNGLIRGVVSHCVMNQVDSSAQCPILLDAPGSVATRRLSIFGGCPRLHRHRTGSLFNRWPRRSAGASLSRGSWRQPSH